MKKMILAAALLFAFSASAQTSQPCGARSKGSLVTSKNYDGLLNTNAAAGTTNSTSLIKARGAK